MRFLTLLTAALAMLCAGCLDLPVDDWEKGRKAGPGYYRSNYYKGPGGSYRSGESVQVIPGASAGTTNIYVGSVYPNGYAAPVYPAYGAGYGRPYGGGSRWGVAAKGNYKGVDYGVGYGGGAYGSGGYGYAKGQNGKTSWAAAYGSGGAYNGAGYGYGGNNGYGIYGNGNGNQGSNVTPSRFSTYR